jgi:hypothetical protein
MLHSTVYVHIYRILHFHMQYRFGVCGGFLAAFSALKKNLTQLSLTLSH